MASRIDSVPPEVIEPAHVAGSPCNIEVTMATTSVSQRRRPGHTPCVCEGVERGGAGWRMRGARVRGYI